MTRRRKWLPAVALSLIMTGLATPMSAQTGDATPPSTAAVASDQQGSSQQAYTLQPDQLAKAIQLSRIRNILNIGDSLWSLAVLWVLLAVGAWAVVEGWAKGLTNRRWVQGLIFFAAFVVIGAVTGLPLDWLGEHYERMYGISVQGWGSWLGDEGKSLALSLVFGVPVMLLFHWIVRRWPRRYWLGVWLATLPILVILTFALPLFVPLFYRQEPLEKNHAALVARLETVVARTGINIPPDRMYLIKASAKSTGLNAFVAGMGATKRFVMWDTATDQLPDDEVEFVFGHESGHYVLNHVPKETGGDALGLLVVYWACAGFAAWLVRRYGARWGAPDLASRTGFVVLMFAISIASFLLEPAGNAFSRHFEHEADVYGQEAIHGIVADPQKTAVASFNALGRAWLEDPNPSPLIEFWLYSHPSVEHRAEFAAHYDPWANGGHGQFFKN